MLYQDVMRLDADVLLRETDACAREERHATVRLLVRLAAVEARRLYGPAGHGSMWDYCLAELGLSEDAAARRLWAARKGREFPGLFDALAAGRIRLTSVHLLAAHLSAANADELIAAAEGRTKTELQDWLAARFPRPAIPTTIEPAACRTCAAGFQGVGDTVPEPKNAQPPQNPTPIPHALARVNGPGGPEAADDTADESGARPALLPPSSAPLSGHVHARVEPLNAEQVALRFTVDRQVLAKMQRALDLLGHRVGPRDVAAVFERALDALLPVLEREKFAATARPQAPRDAQTANTRTIPARVKRAVWARDGGQCTFVNANGRRCNCRRALEFDHVRPVALGGLSTEANLRLLCPAHNQCEAERRLGAEFMRGKRGARGRCSSAPSSKPFALKAPFEDELRSALREREFTPTEVSIGLSAAARLTPGTEYEPRIAAALRVLGRAGAVLQPSASRK